MIDMALDWYHRVNIQRCNSESLLMDYEWDLAQKVMAVYKNEKRANK
jgi:hypothetical protein